MKSLQELRLLNPELLFMSNNIVFKNDMPHIIPIRWENKKNGHELEKNASKNGWPLISKFLENLSQMISFLIYRPPSVLVV